MRPIGLVEQFHKLIRTIEFDLFGFLNLQILNLQNGSSTGNLKEFKLGKSTVVDNVENPDMRDPLASDTGLTWKLLKP